MKIIQFKISENEEKQIDALKPYFKTKARSKVFKKAMNYAYTSLANLNIIKMKP
jgi:hypothetical protein